MKKGSSVLLANMFDRDIQQWIKDDEESFISCNIIRDKLYKDLEVSNQDKFQCITRYIKYVTNYTPGIL